jgi:glyoxylase-like metal-dependent hydrolase (beta-lactamase superfamily II)
MMQIQTIVSMPFAENTYILWREGRSDAVIVDPGLEPGLILELLKQRQLTAAAILNTHGHADHIAGNGALKQAFPGAPLIIGANDAMMLSDPAANLSLMYGFEIVSPPAEQTVNEGDQLSLAGIAFEVLDIPGHSPGHVAFVVREEPMVVLGGDVLFRGSIGRTDMPGGSFEQLADGIRRKLYTLPDSTVVYPGHGPVTKIGHEKRTNPFVNGEPV